MYITDNTYTKEALVAMEAELLATLGYALTTPTAKTFLRRCLQARAWPPPRPPPARSRRRRGAAAQPLGPTPSRRSTIL